MASKKMAKTGADVKAARLKAALTQPQLAKLAGVSQPTVSMTETGVATCAATIARLLAAIGKRQARNGALRKKRAAKKSARTAA
jgi:DNA-binding XRE family transcriptional regulator